MNKPFSSFIKNNKGMALMVAIFSTLFMMYIAEELAREARIEFEVSSQSVKKIQAYYAAKSGVEVGLLKVLLYKKALHALGDTLGENKSLLNMIWKIPFSWPPEVPKNMNLADQGLLKTALKESLMDNSQYYVVVESEGSKIDINDLGSASEGLAKSTRQQILQIFTQQVENDEEFKDKYDSYNFEELVNNLTDWVDEDKTSLNGSYENALYRDYDSKEVPPNHPFKTIEELRMVHGMNDDFFNLLKERVTVYGTKGINVNTASKEVLMSIDTQLNEEIVTAIQEHINDPDQGPFANLDEFKEFIEREGVYLSDFNPFNIPLYFEEEYNFRITSAGIVSNITKQIEVVTFDINQIKENLITALEEDDKNKGQNNQNQQPPPSPPSQPNNQNQGANNQTKKEPKKQKPPAPKGRPTIVYWQET